MGNKVYQPLRVQDENLDEVYDLYKKLLSSPSERRPFSIKMKIVFYEKFEIGSMRGYCMISKEDDRKIYLFEYVNRHYERDSRRLERQEAVTLTILPIRTYEFRDLPYLFAIRIR